MSTFDEIIEREFPLIPGWCTIEKGKRMGELSNGETLCVELGVFGGRGLLAMGLATSHKVYGVDPYTAEAALEGKNDPANDEWWESCPLEEIYQGALAMIDRVGLTGIAEIIRLKSVDAAEKFLPGSIGVLHQDANHSTETSRAEVALWAPKIRIGGLWIFDDTNWSTTLHAQRDLVERGFEEIEDHETWKVFQRRK